MTWNQVTKVEKIKTRLGLMDGCKSEGQVVDLVPMDRGNGEKQVRSKSMNQYGHVMI
jgi:hypothetical protein